ncbi:MULTISPECIES: hypothetical protein [Lacticaseibacillus]|uniref:hypothetical protein n=1 Tax=Lacticaseibacillus TaxID=2759736 RepID=UPI00046A892E|nr:hypothetical protein [Lacticaseibacillus casei]MBI6598609.1 hypothetical protein [Lacticaseibacillus casei]MBO1482280.1 hypothetical protein [Lacticaseibacillus casei]MBO2417547.1 hypothetical protein [Lacticaseibacillus casei]MCK2081923.1 hypothetical protein [Lacticaseibacillus casei]MDZ5494882.1 hypothetical protein [Lacticaseibacillus casei]
MKQLITTQLRVVFCQYPVISILLFIIFMPLQLLLVCFGQENGFSVKAYHADQHLVTWLMVHLPWFLSYLLPAIFLFPVIGQLRSFISLMVEIRLSGKFTYTLASYATVGLTSIITTLSFAFLPMLISHESFDFLETATWLVSILTATIGFFCFAAAFNETYAFLLYVATLILTASVHHPYLIVTSLDQSPAFTVNNLVVNLVYLFSFFLILLLIFKHRNFNLVTR